MFRNQFALTLIAVFPLVSAGGEGFELLFPKDGVPEGWTVRAWSDVGKPGPEGAKWVVEDGVLNGGGARGSWLISERPFAHHQTADSCFKPVGPL